MLLFNSLINTVELTALSLTHCTLQMWSFRDPFSLNGRMSNAEDSLVLENNNGQRYGIWKVGELDYLLTHTDINLIN